jgi:hypothetical protein
MKESRKSRAFNTPYESVRQMVLSGFETPFERELNKANRWIVLSHLIPWDGNIQAKSTCIADGSSEY